MASIIGWAKAVGFQFLVDAVIQAGHVGKCFKLYATTRELLRGGEMRAAAMLPSTLFSSKSTTKLSLKTSSIWFLLPMSQVLIIPPTNHHRASTLPRLFFCHPSLLLSVFYGFSLMPQNLSVTPKFISCTKDNTPYLLLKCSSKESRLYNKHSPTLRNLQRSSGLIQNTLLTMKHDRFSTALPASWDWRSLPKPYHKGLILTISSLCSHCFARDCLQC